MGINHEFLQTMYKGAILTLLLYGAPVWAEATKYENNRHKYIRVQRLINIKIAKAFRTISSEALCILAVTTPIEFRTEEAVRRYYLRKGIGDSTTLVDRKVESKHWPHPTDIAPVIEVNDYEDKYIKLFTDGSKSEQRIGAKCGHLQRNGTRHTTEIQIVLQMLQ
jgi:hypothetical protein